MANRWRTFLNERGRQPLVSRNFIDGDLIESFPDLPTSEKEGIFSELKDYIESMEELHNLVDGLSRIH